MKNIIIPIILFIISAFLSAIFFPFIFISVLIGIYLHIKNLKNNRNKNILLTRSSLSLIIAPLISVALVTAGMSGLFSIFSGN